MPVTSTRITSRHNPVVARYRAVARGDVDGLLLLDGAHLVNDAIAAGLTIEHAAVDINASERDEVARLLASLRSADVETISVTAPADALSPVRSSSAIVSSRAARRQTPRTSTVGRRRAAHRCAFGIPAILARSFAWPKPAAHQVSSLSAAVPTRSAGSAARVDGSALRLPLQRVDDAAVAVADARRHGCRVVATAPRNGRSLFDVDLRPPTAVLIGGEGPGLPDSIVDAADERVTIPMQTPVESLNAAVTAALVVYEAQRQRT